MKPDRIAQTKEKPWEHHRVGPITGRATAWLDPLSPWSILVFIVLAAAWLVVRVLPEPDPRWFRPFSRAAAYLATLAMLVPYVHILRRCFRYRYWGLLTTWTRWHVRAAYAGFFLAIVHTRARSNNGLTLLIQGALWAVMLSGVVGLYGQKLIYRLMALFIKRELGLERLDPERDRLVRQAEQKSFACPIVGADDVLDWPKFLESLKVHGAAWQQRLTPTAEAPPDGADAERAEVKKVIDALLKALEKSETQQRILDAVNRLLDEDRFLAIANLGEQPPSTPNETQGGGDPNPPAPRETIRARNHQRLANLSGESLAEASARTQAIDGFLDRALRDLRRPLASPAWMFSRSAFTPVPENHFRRARYLALPAQQEVLDAVWPLLEERRQIDLEYSLHRLGRAWLLFHGPASYALLILLAAHIGWSLCYGGYW